MNQLKFTVFADLHYKKHMYAATVSTLGAIIERAQLSGSDFILHAGDLCNDYKGSPELTNALLRNKYSLPVYGVYGNHELESRGNTMEFVTPLLTNRPVIGDNYYYFDVSGYRFVILDTNYSLLDGKWVHNTEASWGAPNGSTLEHSLGARQLEWLDNVLSDAKRLDKLVVVVSHAGFFGVHTPSPDAGAVLEMFDRVNKDKKTVILVINGHYHTDHITERNGVIFFDCNTVLNGFWYPSNEQHYLPGETFEYEDYDSEGRFIKTEQLELTSLSQAKNTRFFIKPLSAVVTLKDDIVTIEGSKTEWMYGREPVKPIDGKRPKISDLGASLD